MKEIEIGDNLRNTLITLIIASFLIGFTSLIGSCSIKEQTTAFENGYEKRSLVGAESPRWQKVKE